MWSFGNKREDHSQVPPGKASNGNNSQQQQIASNRNGDPGTDQQKQPQHQQLAPRGGSLAAKSRMFYKNKKLSSSNHGNTNSTANTKSTGQTPRTPQQEVKKKRYFGVGGNNRRASVSNTGDEYLQDVNVDETSSGIEVSFPGSQSASGTRTHYGRISGQSPVISLKDLILERQRVFASQFSTVLSVSSNTSFPSINTNKWKPKGHRIPLLGITAADADYSDTLHLLKNAPIVDERTAVREELNLLENEISSLEGDRIWLEQRLQSTSANFGNQSDSSSSLNKENVTWDAHKLLKDDAIKKQPLSESERNALQKQRGNSLTIHLTNDRTQEAFVQKFGGKQQNSRSPTLFRNDDNITTIVPNNKSSADVAATTLQHVSLISPCNKENRNGGLYFSQDTGKSQNIGQLPRKLSNRFDMSKMDADNQTDIEDLAYLSTGSRGCYFAKFQSGECWWGSAVEDADFQNILNSWDVYRVAFGPIESIECDQLEQQVSSEAPPTDNKRNAKSNNKAISTFSWIILSHDGKAAWKNLPSRLSNKLRRRLANSAAPVEVSLGPGDSYFVRFLDGSIDYSLPFKIARVCERIEERGGSITNISLHPDIPHDFVIRHTELTR